MTKATLASVALFAVLLAAPVVAKGLTSRITLRDPATGRTVELTAEAVVERFQVWSGPGTLENDVAASEGFIIDWTLGTANDRRPGRRYQVEFYARKTPVAPEELAYTVLYQPGVDSQRGVVYLPGRLDEGYRRNVATIMRGDGLEGQWFHATRAWDDAVRGLLPVR